jgi:L-aspartate oxidase
MSAAALIRLLPSVAPRWRREADVVVVGSGAAGITTALTAAAQGLSVLMITKDVTGGASPLAQGGLAAAIGPGDSPREHARDTMTAGAGLCDLDTVSALAAGSPGAIDWLVARGARLEQRELRLEGGHSRRRIVHSGDDASGAEVHRALLAALRGSPVEVQDRTIALDLVLARGGDPPAPPDTAAFGAPSSLAALPRSSVAPLSPDGAGGLSEPSASAFPSSLLGPDGAGGLHITGLLAARIGADGALDPGLISARTVVLAAGGLGQAFATTSNPVGATGDAIAIAARAGAVLRDLEFVQFHPTVLWSDGATGQRPLITEALRGAGATLRDLNGKPVMAGRHPLGDLAPRDIVAAGMFEVMEAAGSPHLWLDATALDRDVLTDGFPTVTAACRKEGVDPVTDLIPVAPGAHYSCGGIAADMSGQTSIRGLYAVGEAASTGVHGANRLASNSLVEAVIMGRNAGQSIAADRAAGVWGCPPCRGREPSTAGGSGGSPPRAMGSGLAAADRAVLAGAMSRYAGVVRDADGLRELLRIATYLPASGPAPAARLPAPGEGATASPRAARAAGVPEAGRNLAAGRPTGVVLGEEIEGVNLHAVSVLIAAAALERQESRGCHRRRDTPETADQGRHTVMRWTPDGLKVTVDAIPQGDDSPIPARWEGR